MPTALNVAKSSTLKLISEQQHDKCFPPEPLSLKEIENELFLDDLKKRQRNNTPQSPVTPESKLSKMESQLNDLHKVQFSELKGLSQEENIAKFKAQILNRPIKK